MSKETMPKEIWCWPRLSTSYHCGSWNVEQNRGSYPARHTSYTRTDHAQAVIDGLVDALEVAIGYPALVADGVGNMPILKDRAKSDCEVISKALAAAKEWKDG